MMYAAEMGSDAMIYIPNFMDWFRHYYFFWGGDTQKTLWLHKSLLPFFKIRK
jgi:hypothetical protein